MLWWCWLQEYDEELEKYSHQGMDEILLRRAPGQQHRPGTCSKPQLCHSCHIVRPIRAKHCK